jgi:hypothetical protein
MENASRRCRALVLVVVLMLVIAGSAVAMVAADGPPCQGALIGQAHLSGTPITGSSPALDHLRAELLARWRRLLAPFLGGAPAGTCPAPPANIPGDVPC